MFSTIRTKILFSVLALLAALLSVFAFIVFIFFNKAEDMIISGYFHRITALAHQINRNVVEIQNNVRDMAAFGEVYYNYSHNRDFLEKYLHKIFANYTESTGGGIWYEPFFVDTEHKYYCLYAFRKDENTIVSDDKFEDESYDYFNRDWYKTLKAEFQKGDVVAWSSPYYEEIGSEKFMVTAGAPMFSNGKFIGMATVDWGLDDILKSVSALKPTPGSFTLFADSKNDYIYVLTDGKTNNPTLSGKSLKSIPWYNDNIQNTRSFKYNNIVYFPYVKYLDNGMILIVNIPKNELFGLLFVHFAVLFFVLISFGMLLCFFLYKILKHNVIIPIDKLMSFARKISEGDNNVHIEIDKPEEFAMLAATVDKMTKDIKNAALLQAKTEKDLSVAKSIQASSLPNIFPAFPERSEFDLYADMTPAKAVGGDFYDFFFKNKDSMVFLIADVSGKGVPAALFMMKVKTLTQNIARTVKSPERIVNELNSEICKDNGERLFVTMFIGIFNILSGKLTVINCGHNPPLIKSAAGDYKYYDVPSNIVLGAFPDAKFETVNINLAPGDTIFLYTDGVTEASDPDNNMYGVNRLSNFLNENKSLSDENLIKKLKSDIFEFCSNNEYTDDITMLIFRYIGFDISDGFSVPAKQENYPLFYKKFHEILDKYCITGELAYNAELCAEELFTNVASYAYPSEVGNIEFSLTKKQDNLVLCFTDSGIPYNPLEKTDPDISLNLENRPVGGLGIFMIKQIAKNITYNRLDDKNILTVTLS